MTPPPTLRSFGEEDSAINRLFLVIKKSSGLRVWLSVREPGPGLFCFVLFCSCKQRPLQSSLIETCSPSFSFTSSLSSPGEFSPSKLALSHGLPFSNLFWRASDIRITSEKEKESFYNSLTCNWHSRFPTAATHSLVGTTDSMQMIAAAALSGFS